MKRSELCSLLAELRHQLENVLNEFTEDAGDAEVGAEVASCVQQISERVGSLKQLVTSASSSSVPEPTDEPTKDLYMTGLQGEHYLRYGRQLILKEVGRTGQELLAKSSVLVVGAGGIGSSALLYLAAMGVGRIGIADVDVVEEHNLHRQVIHNEGNVGQLKTVSARNAVLSLSRWTRCDRIDERVTADTAERIAADYQYIVDCTDNVSSRYLLNDVAVLQSKPLVSASALRTDAQLHLIDPRTHWPCYRCLYPNVRPPVGARPAASCSDAGVLGVVPGLIGCIAALEAVKIIINVPIDQTLAGRVLLFDGYGGDRMFRVVALKARKPDCRVCGATPTITSPLQPADYPDFYECQVPSAPRHQFPEHTQLSPSAYEQFRIDHPEHLLIDVRNPIQYNIFALPGAVNVQLASLADFLQSVHPHRRTVFVCRRGRLSSQALALAIESFPERQLFHIEGGLQAYNHFDSSVPLY